MAPVAAGAVSFRTGHQEWQYSQRRNIALALLRWGSMFFVMTRMVVVVGILVTAFMVVSCGLSSNGMGSYKPHPPPPPPGPGGVVAPASAH
jgi:hypothetical protein